MTDSTPKSYSSDPALYLYTSLTSGSSHIVTATSRMETILKANRIPFKALDIATDEKARMLWGRRSGKDEGGRARKIPGLVQMGLVIGDLVEVEDWNEYGELKQHVTMYYDEFTTPSKPPAAKSAAPTPSGTPSKPPANQKENVKPVQPAAGSSKAAEPSETPAGGQPTSFTLAMRQAGQEAAQKAKEVKKKATETFVGVGKAEPEKKKEDKSAALPPPISLEPKNEIETTTLAQSPTSTAWNRDLGEKATISSKPAEKLEFLQSPTSTAWEPTDINQPVLTHRGSNISEASAEYIKQVEDECTIPEEDEDDEEEEKEAVKT